MSINDEAMSEFIADDGHAIGREPFQFTLRQLFWLMGIVCVLGGAYSWLGTMVIGVVAGFALVGALGFAIYMASSGRFVEAIALLALVGSLLALLLPAVQSVRDMPPRAVCADRLRTLGLALQQYESVHGALPPDYIAAPDGTPMHSWRILLLPYLERQDLYQRYNFNESWDGPNNRKLHKEVVRIFCCPGCSRSQPRTETNFVAVVGAETLWRPDQPNSLARVAQFDGTASTLMLVEVHGSGIHWMEPRDLDFSKLPMAINSKQGIGISSPHSPNRGVGANVLFADGQTQWLDNNTPAETIRAILTAKGRE